MLAGIVFNAEIGQVLIGGTNDADHATVIQDGDIITVDQRGYSSQQFDIADVAFVHFVGLGGDDYFENQSSVPSRAYGQDGNDTFIGGSGDDRLLGHGGNDTLEGNGGNDFLLAGSGDDTASGGAGDDRILGTAGANRLDGQDGNDTIFGGRDNDEIFGGDGDNRLVGWLGDDRISGGSGSDRIHGGDGDDIVSGRSGDDFIFGQAGDDVLNGGSGSDVLNGHDGDDEFWSQGGGDRVIGGAGADRSSYFDNSVEYRVVGSGNRFFVTDLRQPTFDGEDNIFSVEEFNFLDGVHAPGDLVRQRTEPVRETIYVQPVIVSDSDDSSRASWFGHRGQIADILERVDQIYAQAEVAVEFLPVRLWSDTFTNYGGTRGLVDRFRAERPEGDLDRIVDRGDSAGIGSSDGDVIDLYFVDRVPGFAVEPTFTVNGLAFVDASGIAIHVGEELNQFADGREIVAQVTAHEIGHNLGLFHEDGLDNLLSTGGSSIQLNQEQIETILDSRFTQRD